MVYPRPKKTVQLSRRDTPTAFLFPRTVSQLTLDRFDRRTSAHWLCKQMFGIRGLDPFGVVHALLGISALHARSHRGDCARDSRGEVLHHVECGPLGHWQNPSLYNRELIAFLDAK
jgi:hypothetical protein